MKVVNDKVASGDPTAKRLEAEYATLVETRGSQNRIPKMEKADSNSQPQATEDLESKFQLLANAAGTLPGQPGYKRLLRKFLTAEYATNAQEYCSNARNVKDKNKTFKFEALALVCGLNALKSTTGHEKISSTKNMAQETNHCTPEAASSQPDNESATMKSLRNKIAAARLDGAVSASAARVLEAEVRFEELALSLRLIKGRNSYKNYRRQFFEYESSRDHILKSGDDIAIEKLERFEESCAARGLQQGSKEFRTFKKHFDIENENDTETSTDSSFSMCGFTSADDDSQYALQFKGRLKTGNNHGQPEGGVVGGRQVSDGKQPRHGHNRAQKDGSQKGSGPKDGAPKDSPLKDGARKTGPQKGSAGKDGAPKDGAQKGRSNKSRAEKAKEEFNAYFPDTHKLENWQKLCRDLGINPVPSSITKCKMETKKIYVNIYQFLHQIKTGFPATRFPSQKALAKYCNGGSKRKFPRQIAKERGALAGLLHYLY
ncbi:hypothetical protein VC83_08066 [Pseudogymnoascus destructans]|uniref:Uncharacterized protein n=2 Tax=Pseudogymnoascus destructans TaxID=655981 RepID=L8G850_PSED2|nr:uncharacterized protein VC83_08066 [Pseudogymnoascus destructans]ELR08176.1 hypothetical protein GMDG_02988 [Pseudogymnoascus destructans 20631-21]OAF55969.1 hypothetical protein VC83_08066 [Pseudogymnoascus destructans]